MTKHAFSYFYVKGNFKSLIIGFFKAGIKIIARGMSFWGEGDTFKKKKG